MENTIRLDLNETPCNSDDENGNYKSTEAENGGGVMSENSIDDVVSLDNMDEAAVDNMLNASMENMAEAAVGNMAEAAVDNMVEPVVDMCFVTGEEFAVFYHDYAYRKGFTFYTRTTELMKGYKEMGVGRTAVGLKKPMYHMMKVIRLNYKYGGKKQTNGSIVTGMSSLCVWSHDRRQNGHENISYNQRDVRNVVHLNRHKSRLEGDAVALKYFQQQYEYNHEFYSAIERDNDGRLMNAFWSDARSRAMHKDFGDIITFDTTFLCNRYRLPFAPFVGCMGNPPKGILTDQCKAIAKAVETVFVGWKEMEEALRNVVHDTLDPDEFDEAWGFMVEKFGIHDN
ncbi:Protein FAR1-RELATED SEQUENCE 3, partial [Bienertia sinuspersici]